MTDVDQMVSVARDCARAIHGNKATLAFEENPSSFPDDKRWRASVKIRGVVVDAKHGPTHSESVKRLTQELASRSRAIAAPHQRTAFQAAVLGV